MSVERGIFSIGACLGISLTGNSKVESIFSAFEFVICFCHKLRSLFQSSLGISSSYRGSSNNFSRFPIEISWSGIGLSRDRLTSSLESWCSWFYPSISPLTSVKYLYSTFVAATNDSRWIEGWELILSWGSIFRQLGPKEDDSSFEINSWINVTCPWSEFLFPPHPLPIGLIFWGAQHSYPALLMQLACPKFLWNASRECQLYSCAINILPNNDAKMLVYLTVWLKHPIH